MNKNIIQKFKKFDKKILETNNIKLIEIWFSLRYAVFYNFVSPFYFQKKKKNYFKSISKLIIQFLQIFKIPFFLFKKEKILVMDTGRYKFYKNGYNDTVTEILKKNNLKFKTLSISNNSSLFDKKINILFLSNVIHLILKFLKKEDEEFFLLKKFFLNFFGENKVKFNNIYKQIYLQQKSIYILFKFFTKIFNSKIIIYFENANLAKCIQYCGKKNIKTIDIQHALSSDLNILYKFYMEPKFSYLLTKKIFLWGNYCKRFYSYSHRCISIGYFDKNNIKNYKKKKQIFVVSSIFSRADLIKLIKYISLNLKDYKIIYKLRPEENFDEIKKIINFSTKNITFMKNNYLTTVNKTIAESQYIIGTNSSMLVEALGITDIIVFKRGWFREYSEFIKNKLFLSADTYEEVISIVKRKRKNVYSTKKINNIFKKNFNQNFKIFFQKELYD